MKKSLQFYGLTGQHTNVRSTKHHFDQSMAKKQLFHYIFDNKTPRIAYILHINVKEGRTDRLMELGKLEEHQLLAIQHQEIQKKQQKAWHDRNIKNKNMLIGDLALLYNS